MVAQLERIVDSNSWAVDSSQNTAISSQASAANYEPLYAANYAFVQLLHNEAQTLKSPPLPLSLARTLARLSPQMLQRIARCPFALFDVRGMLVNNTHERTIESSRSISSAHYSVASASLFFVWHQLHLAPVQARLWFGLDAHTANALRASPAHVIADLANQHADALLPCASRHVLFWPGLLRHAESGDTSRLQAVVWLGRQLLTAPAFCG